jgi:hypothetical protein
MQQGSYNGWKDVCRPKECGGLGAKDLRLFDMAGTPCEVVLASSFGWGIHVKKCAFGKGIGTECCLTFV